MIGTGDIDAFLGLDVGKGEHHATAITPAGKRAFDKSLPNTEPKLRELFAKLQAKHGTVLVVVDQPASIGALPLAVARDMGCPVAYLPGLTIRRIADLYPGEAKTDAKDAFIIADYNHDRYPDLAAYVYDGDGQYSVRARLGGPKGLEGKQTASDLPYTSGAQQGDVPTPDSMPAPSLQTFYPPCENNGKR